MKKIGTYGTMLQVIDSIAHELLEGLKPLSPVNVSRRLDLQDFLKRRDLEAIGKITHFLKVTGKNILRKMRVKIEEKLAYRIERIALRATEVLGFALKSWQKSGIKSDRKKSGLSVKNLLNVEVDVALRDDHVALDNSHVHPLSALHDPALKHRSLKHELISNEDLHQDRKRSGTFFERLVEARARRSWRHCSSASVNKPMWSGASSPRMLRRCCNDVSDEKISLKRYFS